MRLKRIHFLAAEMFSYSYDNYEGHLGINARFDKYMPDAAALFERAEEEGWSDEQIATKTDFKLEDIPKWRERYREARDIVDADTPAQSFLRAVRASVEYTVEQGLDDEKSIDNLVGQICYRAADLSFLLRQRMSHCGNIRKNFVRGLMIFRNSIFNSPECSARKIAGPLDFRPMSPALFY